MHAILNFRSPERAVNKYEIKCLLKCCGRDVDRIERSTLLSLPGLQESDRVTGVASRVSSLRVWAVLTVGSPEKSKKLLKNYLFLHLVAIFD